MILIQILGCLRIMLLFLMYLDLYPSDVLVLKYHLEMTEGVIFLITHWKAFRVHSASY